MICLYHGSTVDIDRIDLAKSRPNKDFGRGFYLSADRHQAWRMGEFKALTEGGTPVLNTYLFDEQVLASGGGCCYRLEVVYVSGAAEGLSAHSNPPNQTSLLTGSYLFHFHPDMKLFGKVFYKLAEIHPTIGDIIEYRFCSVSLKFHISNFHIQAQVGRQNSGAYHCFMFSGYGLLPPLYVLRAGLAVNSAEFV